MYSFNHCMLSFYLGLDLVQSKGNVPALLDLEGIGEELSKREWLKVEGVAL